MEAIENAIVTPIKELASQLGFAADLLLAAAGAALVIILFLLSLIFKGKSATRLFTKKLDGATAFLKASEEINEDNVEAFNNKLKSMPESVIRGWGFFLEQKVGYPSDYITSRDVLCDNKLSSKNRAGRTFLRITSVLVIVLTIWLEYVIGKGASLASVGLADFTADFGLVASIIAVFCAPLLIYIIFSAVLGALYNKQFKLLEASFAAFQNALDEKVIIYAEEEDEFVSENIGEINAEIEEIISDKLENKEIIEIVTAPKVEPEEIIEVAVPEEPVQQLPIFELAEEPVDSQPEAEEVAVITLEDTAEEAKVREQRLTELVYIIDTAVYNDASISREDIEELATIINKELQSPYRDADDLAVLENCMYKLAAKHEMLLKTNK
ncbi:MAG: hypothetical protein PHC84_01250 [Clostridia bacterium]|nr:hypothetical protein [Clostridia bacterium]